MKEKLTYLNNALGAGIYFIGLLIVASMIYVALQVGYRMGSVQGRKRFKLEVIEGGMAHALQANVVPLVQPDATIDTSVPEIASHDNPQSD